MEQQIINVIEGYLKTYRIDDDTFSEQANEIYQLIKPIIETEKPDWNDAPEWATHLAQDFHGQWHWFRGEPKPDGQYWLASKYYNQRAFIPNQNWKETLEKRPS